MHPVGGHGAQMHPGRADRRTGHVARPTQHARAQRGHHHVDIAQADRRACQQARRLSGIRGQRMGHLRTVDDRRQQAAPMRQAQRVDDRVIIGPAAEVAEGEAGLGRVCRPNAGQVQIQPVLAMQRDPRPIQQVRMMGVHMGHLRALLAGVQAGARRLEPGAVLAQAADGRCGTRVQPQPGIAHRAVVSDQPGAVALPRHGQRRGPPRQVRDMIGQPAQRGGAIIPGAGHVLRRCALRPGRIAIRHRRRAQLTPGKIEPHGLDDRGPGIDSDQHVALLVRHDASIPWPRFISR